jgi:hypothetical protein
VARACETAVHEVIVTPFGFASTADDVVNGLDLSGKQVIVTGGASGIYALDAWNAARPWDVAMNLLY